VAMETRAGRAGGYRRRTIWGRSSESFPMVLKTRSCNLLTVDSRSSPSAAMVATLRPFVLETGVA
jgi:hypothetical protein